MRKLSPLLLGWGVVVLGNGITLCAAVLLLSLSVFNLLDRSQVYIDREGTELLIPEAELESQPAYRRIDSLLLARGFVRLDDYDTLLCIDLRYATSNTFAQKAFYTDLTGCWLHPLAANRLLAAAKLLRESHNDSLRLLVYDATRPQSAQYELYSAACSVGAGGYVAVPWGGGRFTITVWP